MGGLLAMLALAGSVEAAEPTRRYALLVGANDGGHGRTVLQYAHRDARAVADVLTSLGGVDVADHTLLLDPDLDEVRGSLDALQATIAQGSGRAEVIFYYSGHSDETGLLIGEDRLPYDELRDDLEALPADVRLAVLDSCASGAMIRTKGGKRIAPFLVDESSQVGGFAYITSSSATEVAQEGDSIGGSYFTHYLTTGLRGAADLSGDGRVDLNEAYSFAYEATLSHTEKTQHGPQHAMKDMNLSGKGDLVLTDLQLTDASLVLDETLEGRALVRDDDGALVAEVTMLPGRAVELGLDEGPYALTLTRDGAERYATAEFDLVGGETHLLGTDDLVWWSGERTVARGGAVGDGEPPQAMVTSAVDKRSGNHRFHFTSEPVPDGVDKLVFGPVVHAHSAELDGISMGTVASVVDGRAAGIQTSLVYTHAGELDGLQTGLFLNHAGGGTGVQSSVAVNVAGGDFEGFQGSAGVNVADGLRGLQLSLVNVGRRVSGAQVGLINVAGEVKGTQVGLINVATDVKGAPVGLLSIEKNGRHDLSVGISESDLALVDFKLGGKHLYTLFAAGGTPGRHVQAGLGFGVHADLSTKAWLDLDAAYHGYVAADGSPVTSSTGVARGRGLVGLQLAKQLAPFVGVSVNVRALHDPAAALPIAPSWTGVPPDGVVVWPGAFAGVQF